MAAAKTYDSSAKLRPRLAAVPQCAAARLRALFAREDELRKELAQVEAEQREARNLYAAERGLLVRPSVASVRKVLDG
jgi:predicted kinase